MEENVQSESKNSVWLLVVAVIVAIVITLVLWFAFRTDLPKAMLDVKWEWIQLTETMPASQSVVADSENYNIVFSADDTYNAKADCNMLSGGYEATRSSLTLLPGPSTLAECGPDSSYDLYVGFLAQVDGYKLENNRLILTFGDGAGKMIFQSAGRAK